MSVCELFQRVLLSACAALFCNTVLDKLNAGMACLLGWIISVMLAAVAAEFRQGNLKSPFRLRIVSAASCVLLACSISLFVTVLLSVFRSVLSCACNSVPAALDRRRWHNTLYFLSTLSP
jgi:hypothetical protein